MPNSELDIPAQTKERVATLYEQLPEQQPEQDYLVREHLLGVFSLLHSGEELSLGWWNQEAINYGDYKTGRSLSSIQRLDLLELSAGIKLRRHEWAHELINDSSKPRWTPFLKRMHELELLDERDHELERATIEVGSRLIMGSDENGNRMITYKQARADQIFQLHYSGYPKHERLSLPTLRQDIIGFPLDGGRFAYGEWHGFEGADAHRWFVQGGGFAAPLDTITDIGSMWEGEDNKLIGVEFKRKPLVDA